MVVNEVPVKELLFALARDAALNIDVHPDIVGQVTLNAVDQTLTQILDRISRQADLRRENRAGTLLILPDRPFLRNYQFDYVNVARDTASDTQTSTEVATVAGAGGGGGGGNASSTQVSNVSSNRVWETVIESLRHIVMPDPNAGEPDPRETVIANAESGVIVVRATASQHDLVQAYLDQVSVSLHRQVLIESTIVEVELSDSYQSGIDFTRFLGQNLSGFSLSNVTNAAFVAATSGVPGLLLSIGDQQGTAEADINVVVRLLKEFGDTRVLSSPKLMTLNNQTALLKVVDNEVYFTVEVKESEDVDTGDITQEITSNVNTVPVGLVMTVTPQINAADSVTLNVRPTITRIREFVNDPGVAIVAARFGGLGAANIINRVPVVQVRETETMLRINSRQIAVLGGLMQDRRSRQDDGTPGLSDLDQVGGLFEFRDRESVKTELVIFLRATVIRTPDVNGDLRGFAPLLPGNIPTAAPLPTPFEAIDPEALP